MGGLILSGKMKNKTNCSLAFIKLHTVLKTFSAAGNLHIDLVEVIILAKIPN